MQIALVVVRLFVVRKYVHLTCLLYQKVCDVVVVAAAANNKGMISPDAPKQYTKGNMEEKERLVVKLDYYFCIYISV